MPTGKSPKPIFPNTRMISELRKRGYKVDCQWEITGPPGTAWLTCYIVNSKGGGLRCPIIVQTFADHQGETWEVWAPTSDRIENDATIAATLERLEADV